MDGYISLVIAPVPKVVPPRIVNPALKKMRRMAESLSDTSVSPRANFVVTCVAALAGVVSFLVWWDSHTARMATLESIQAVQQQQISQMTVAIHELVNSGLRPEEVNSHLHALDSRTDDIQKQLRSDEERITRSLTLLEEANRQRK